MILPEPDNANGIPVTIENFSDASGSLAVSYIINNSTGATMDIFEANLPDGNTEITRPNGM